MSNMYSSTKARTSGDNGGGGEINRQSQPHPASNYTVASRMAAIASASYQPDAHSANQRQDLFVDLTSLDDSTDTKSTVGVLTNNQHLGNSLEPIKSVEDVPKFDPEAPEPGSFGFPYGVAMTNTYRPGDIQPIAKFESQPLEPANAGMEIYRFPPYTQANTFAELGSLAQATSDEQASTPAPVATPTAPTSRHSRGITEAPRDLIENVLPNRIAEAGPIPHPDRDWRPYGTNHWHVFTASPETLKYLSTSEIKEIREHCYRLSRAVDGDGRPTTEPVPIPETAFTTADAQAVWRHCDAYIRRRGQLRNNNAARRSRQKREAETRYWRRKALEYGCPDHEFVWDERDATPAASTNAYASNTPAGAGAGAAAASSNPPQTRARDGQRRSERVRGQRQAAAAAAAAAPRGQSIATDEVATGFD